MNSVAGGGVAAAGAESARTIAARCVERSSSNVAGWSMSACLSGDIRSALDSRPCCCSVPRRTSETPAAARSSRLSPASRPEPAPEPGAAPGAGAASTGAPGSDSLAITRTPCGGSASGWAIRDPLPSLLSPGPPARARPASRPSAERREAAERNASASSLTSSVAMGGRVSGVVRSATPGARDAASSCREEGVRSGSVRTSVARAVHNSIEVSGRDRRGESRCSARRRRPWGTLAAAQPSSHRQACSFGTCDVLLRTSSNVANADAPPR